MTLLTAWLVTSLGAASPALPLALTLDPGCASVSEPDLRYALAIELKRSLIAKETIPTRGVVTAYVDCGLQLFHVSVRGPSGNDATRAIAWDLTRARDVPRLLSLVIAELAEQVQRPNGTSNNAKPPLAASTPIPEVASQQPARFRFEVVGNARLLRRTLLWGGSVGFVVAFSRRWGLGVDAGYAYSAVGTRLGDVDAHLATVGAWGFWGGQWGAFGADLGLGGHLGLGALRGRPSSASVLGTTQRGFWAAPSVVGKLRWRFAPRLDALLRLEVGRTLHGVVGEVSGAPSIALDGWFGTLGVGVRT